MAAGESRAIGRPALAVLLAAGVLVAYAPVAGFDYVNFDDPQYVTANPVVARGLTLPGLWYALAEPHAKLWHPLATLSHMLDVSLFGLAPGPAHVVNALLHAVGTAVCFLVLADLTGRLLPAAAVTMLVAWHPARVESVAWIAERKDVLSMLCFWATLGAWTRWVRAPAPRRYAVALGWYVAALLSKSMMVTLPGILLLLDGWPLARLPLGGRRLLGEKLPFVALAAGCAAVTYVVQAHGGAVAGSDVLPLAQRVANATVAYVRYLGLVFWPVDLAIFYPYRTWPSGVVALAAGALAALTAGAVALRHRAPWVTMGWAWYGLALFPVSGIVQAGSQSMADRFSYLPSVGIAIALVWSVAALAARTPATTRLAVAAGALAGGVLLSLSARQVRTWRDSETVFAHALAVTGDNYLAHNHYGQALAAQGRFAEAAPHYEASARLNPAYPEAQNNLGNALLRLGRPNEAEPRYRSAIALDPGLANAHNGLGSVLAGRGDDAGAVAAFRAALARAPDYPDALANLAHALRRQGAWAESAGVYERVLALRPAWLDARVGLAECLARMERPGDATTVLRGTLDIDPAYGPARDLLRQLDPASPVALP